MEYFSSDAFIQIRSEMIYKYDHDYQELNIDISNGHTHYYLTNIHPIRNHVKRKKLSKCLGCFNFIKRKKFKNLKKSVELPVNDTLTSLFDNNIDVTYNTCCISTIDKVNAIGPFIIIFDTSYNYIPTLGQQKKQITISSENQIFNGGYAIIPYNNAFLNYDNEDYYCIYTIDLCANVFIIDDIYYVDNIIIRQYGSLKEYFEICDNSSKLFDSILQNTHFLRFLYQITYDDLKCILISDILAIKYISTNNDMFVTKLLLDFPATIQHMNLTLKQQLMIVNKNGLIIQYIQNVHLDAYYVALNNNPEALLLVPENKRDNKMHEIALQKNGMLLKDLDVNDCLKLIALQQNGFAIQYIDNPTIQMKDVAIQQNGLSIQYIDNLEEYQLSLAIENNPKSIIYSTNNIQHTDIIYLKTIKQNGMLLKHCYNCGTQIKLIALHQNGFAIQYIDNPTIQMKDVAIQQNGLSIQYIDNLEEYQENNAIKNNGLALQYIKKPSLETCMMAVKNNGLALEHVPEKYIDHKLIMTALGNNGLALQYVHKPTMICCQVAILNNPNVIAHIIKLFDNANNDQLNINILLQICLKKDGLLIRFVNSPTEEQKLIAIQQNPQALEFINIQTEDLCAIAIRKDGLVIKFVKNQTNVLNEIAVYQNYLAIKFIDDPSTTLIKHALAMDYKLFMYIKNQTDDMCTYVLNKDSMQLKHVKIQILAKCLHAVNNNGMAIYYVHNKTNAICMDAIKQNWKSIRYITNPTNDMKNLALSINSDAKQYF
jgi:hypothetical protein